MKIVYIGAGSFRFSYRLFKNFCAWAKIIPIEVWLVDINGPLLKMMYRFLKRMVEKYNLINMFSLYMTTERREALENADVVLLSISIGQQESEWFDIYIPQKFGLPHTTGDTCGPSGLFRSLRTVPIILNIIKDTNELCPDALHLNYTNPIAPISYAVKKYYPNIEFLGICHELFKGMKTILKLLKKVGYKKIEKWENLDIKYSGLNHFVWLFSCKYNGDDLYPIIRENAHRGGKLAGRPFNFFLLEKYNYFCYPGSRHIIEFLPKYFNYFNHNKIAKYWNMPKLRPVGLLKFGREASIWLYRQSSRKLFFSPTPSIKGERILEMSIDWLKSKAGVYIEDSPRTHPINLPNKCHRIVSNLPEDCILESTGYFKDGKINVFNMGTIPNDIRDLVLIHAKNTPLFVESAISGDPDKLIKALLADPMCQFIEDEDAIEGLMWNILYYQRKWLIPMFEESIPTLEDLKKNKYYINKKELHKKKNAMKVKFLPRKELRKKAFFPKK